MNENPFPKKTFSGIKHIVAVGSGKGGVGKSTVALNLALALKKKGFLSGLLDADVYGPSIPSMTDTKKQKLEVIENKLSPLIKHGVKMAGMGWLVDEGSAVIWRGPMLFKAIEQFLSDVDWGNLDYLIVDLPPGTGDVALTLAQKTPVSGGIIVCTPQNLAWADALRAIAMFSEIQIPLLGVVENMSSMELSGSPVHLFPKGQMDVYLKEKKIDKLGTIPFHPDVGLCGESGTPMVEAMPDSKEAKVFLELAQVLIKKLSRPRSSVG